MKYTPYILATTTIILIYVVFFIFSAYGDYIEFIGLKIQSEKPLVCLVEPYDLIRFYDGGVFNSTLNAIAEWETDLQWPMLYYVVTQQEQHQYFQSQYIGCDVFIFYSEKLREDRIVGFTEFDHRSSKHKFAEIVIFLNKYNDGITIGNKTVVQVPNEELEAIAKHEFGHVLGLGHFFYTLINDNVESVMQQYLTEGKKYNVTDFDVEAVKYYYSKIYRPDCYSRNSIECK